MRIISSNFKVINVEMMATMHIQKECNHSFNTQGECEYCCLSEGDFDESCMNDEQIGKYE